MEAFKRVLSGYSSKIDEEERQILERVVDDVVALVSDRGGATFEEPPVVLGGEDSLKPPPNADQKAIAHLDFEPPDPLTPMVLLDHFLSIDPVLARIFPPISRTDPTLDEEMRLLTFEALHEKKLDNLNALYVSLAGPTHFVFVPEKYAPGWLSGLTDVRLVLASRLGIENEIDAARVQEDAAASQAHGAPDATREEEFQLALASLYTALTWWQESLLSAMSSGDGPNYA